jgi:hypothetical protein
MSLTLYLQCADGGEAVLHGQCAKKKNALRVNKRDWTTTRSHKVQRLNAGGAISKEW